MNPFALLLALLGAGGAVRGLGGSKNDLGLKNPRKYDFVSDDEETDGTESGAPTGKDQPATNETPVDDEETPSGGGMDMPDDEETPTGGGMDMPDDEETPSGGGMDMPDDEETPTGGGMDMPDDEETPTGGGMDMPDDEETPTGGGMDMPDDGGTTSGGGMDMPDDGGTTSGGGMDMPDDGGTTSGGGMDMPSGGGTTSGGGMDMPSGGGMDHNHTPPAITPPAPGASQAEINAYVSAVMSASEVHVHDSTSPKAGEHNAAMNLVPRDQATHVAVSDGDWFDPATWHNGQVPGDDAKALIPEGITVDYGQVSAARLFTVRVDGTLDFDTNADSQMIFDTFVVSPTGHLVIGTPADPVDPNVNVDLIVANNGPIDTNWDPMLLSRGLISHGEVDIHGAMKDSHDKVVTDPMSGDDKVSFGSAPEGWAVGDTIVIAGTHYDGFKTDPNTNSGGYFPPEDEIRVITDIQGNTVFFDTPLVHDHDSPRADLKTSVANYTRNVSIETENADSVATSERGHVMFMHSDDVEVRYMEFDELGRTDKSIISRDINNLNSIDSDSNVQGRYPLHLHRTGITDLQNPAILEGNAVYGSPGWGIVQHDSNALLTNNATYDTFGAGIVSETGNETGVWTDNIVIDAEGVMWADSKNTSVIGDDIFDTARGGEGFWFQGRLIEAYDNVAAGVNIGFAYFHRDGDDRMIDFDASSFAYPDALYGLDGLDADKAPILFFQGNEVFAANQGLHVVKATTLQGHDVWTQLDDFTAWSVMRGVNLEYTSHYILNNFDLVGKTATPFSDPQEGIYLGTNMSEIVINGAQVSGFRVGIDLHKEYIDNHPVDTHQYVVIDADVANNGTAFANYNSSLDTILTSNQLSNATPDITVNQMNYSWADEWIRISGTKTDSIGTINFPGGIEDMDIPGWRTADVINKYGYWTTSNGQNYTLLDIYFTDRGTGQLYYETHPVMIGSDVAFGTSSNGGIWQNTPFNGVQDMVTTNGVTMAGSRVLDQAIPATPSTTSAVVSATSSGSVHDATMAMASMVDTSSSDTGAGTDSGTGMVHDSATTAATTADVWIDGYNGTDPLDLHVYDGQSFTNTGTLENADMTVSGGETVLATGGGEFDVGDGQTLSVFEEAAKIGFDGETGGTAILDFHDGSTLAYGSVDGGLATIEEFDSAAYAGDTPDVESGIDLGNASLAVDLSGLSADAGTAFTLMDSDELVGLFSNAIVGGLGARDATILIDYVSDSVSLQLADGTGQVSVQTVGAETDVDTGEETLWAALTADQGVFSETDAALLPEDEEEDIPEAA